MTRRITLAALAIGLAACGGGSSGGNPTSPGAPSSGAAATITIRSDGTIEPREVRVARGERVRFINQHAQQHQPTSNPHPVHSDCPAVNLPILSTGQSQMTANLAEEKVCNFHDHLNPDTAAFYGTIRVGSADGPGGPVYIRP